LGHIISRDGIQPSRDRILGLLNKQSPTNV
jgi:hypothetical protein